MIILQLNSKELATIVHNAVIEAITEAQISSNPNPNTNNDHITAKQASDFTHIPLATIYAYTSKKKIPHKKLGKRLIFSKQELTGWILSHKDKTQRDIDEEVEVFLSNKKS